MDDLENFIQEQIRRLSEQLKDVDISFSEKDDFDEINRNE